MLGASLVLFVLPQLAPDLDKLAVEYFSADATRRRAIVAAIDGHDQLTAKDVAAWRSKLQKLALTAGPKLKKGGTQYFYDKKKKRGKYIVGGSNGRGGLVIALHGGGEGSGDAGGAASTFGGIASKFKCIMIAPEVLEKTERGWTTSGTEPFVLELIDAAKRTWKNIPHDRVYIVGHSMGGYGSWTIGARHADLFAGLGPYAGAPVPYTTDGGKRSAVVGIEDGVLPNLRNVALHIYQSLDDVQVPPEPNVFANKALLELKKEYGGFPFRYVETNGRGHGAPKGGHVVGFKWLYEHKRQTRPKHLLWQPVADGPKTFYWIGWNQPVAGTLVQAKIVGPNQIDLDMGGYGPDGFRVYLDSKMVDLDKPVVITEAGTELFRGKVQRTLSTMLMTAGRRYDKSMIFAARIDLK